MNSYLNKDWFPFFNEIEISGQHHEEYKAVWPIEGKEIIHA